MRSLKLSFCLLFAGGLAWAAPISQNRPYLEQRAHASFNSGSIDDKKRVIAIIKQSTSRNERMYLHKVMAGGHTTSELADFATQIRGKGDAWLLQQLHLAAQDAGGKGLIQAFDNTCGPTSTQAAHAEMDPLYALATRKGADNFGVFDANDPYRYNKGIATEQAALFNEVSKGAYGPTPRAVNGEGIREDELAEHLGARLGLPLHVVHAPPSDMLDQADKVLAMGLPVVARVSNAMNSGGHFVVILRKHDVPGTAGYLVFDPWTGTTQAVTHDSVVSSSLNIAGWNLMSHVYLF